MFILCILIN